jgi:hypothetical protein
LKMIPKECGFAERGKQEEESEDTILAEWAI